jgi:hypothetical protein
MGETLRFLVAAIALAGWRWSDNSRRAASEFVGRHGIEPRAASVDFTSVDFRSLSPAAK